MIHPTLTPHDLASFICDAGIAAQMVTTEVETPTVPAAAAALGVTPGQIIKSLLFEVQGQPVLVIASGDAPVERRNLAARFGVGKKQIKLASAETVLRCLGYAVGGVPPFGHLTHVPTLLDQTIQRWDVIFGGGGDDHTMLRLTPQELQRVVDAPWADLGGEAAPGATD